MSTLPIKRTAGNLDRIAFSYVDRNGILTHPVGTIVPSPRTQPNHVRLSLDGGGFKSYDPLRIVNGEWAYADV